MMWDFSMFPFPRISLDPPRFSARAAWSKKPPAAPSMVTGRLVQNLKRQPHHRAARVAIPAAHACGCLFFGRHFPFSPPHRLRHSHLLFSSKPFVILVGSRRHANMWPRSTILGRSWVIYSGPTYFISYIDFRFCWLFHH